MLCHEQEEGDGDVNPQTEGQGQAASGLLASTQMLTQYQNVNEMQRLH